MTRSVFRLNFGFLGILFGLLLVACRSGSGSGSGTPEVGSESHFLTSCNATCAQDFECLCGVCTERCSNNDTCSAIYSGAECVDVASRPEASRCEESDGPAFCDVRCTADADCAGLGSGFTCVAEFCRQGTPVGGGDRVELDEICDIYVADVCRAKIDCYDWDYQSYESCLTAQECDGFADLEAMLAAGSVSYDAAAAGDCIALFEADPCALGPIVFAVPAVFEILSWCEALHGNLGEGAACTSGAECGEGLECDKTVTCPGTCIVPPPNDNLPEGSACLTAICIPAQEHCSQCALGLECVNEVCVTTQMVGDPCEGILGCGNVLWCNMNAGVCAPKAQVGEPCSDFRQIAADCAAGLWCDDPPAMPDVAGTCFERSVLGGPCRSDSDCVEPLSCLPGASRIERGTCGTLQPNGSPCDSFADCESDLCDGATYTCVPQPVLGEECLDTCAEGFVCGSAGTCAVKRYAGEACGDTAACIQSRCIGGTCTNRGHFGDPCATADDCLSGVCDGVCIDPVGCAG